MRRVDSEILDHAVKSWPIWGAITGALMAVVGVLLRVIAGNLGREIKQLRESIAELRDDLEATRDELKQLNQLIPQVDIHAADLENLREDCAEFNRRIATIEGICSRKH